MEMSSRLFAFIVVPVPSMLSSVLTITGASSKWTELPFLALPFVKWFFLSSSSFSNLPGSIYMNELWIITFVRRQSVIIGNYFQISIDKKYLPISLFSLSSFRFWLRPFGSSSLLMIRPGPGGGTGPSVRCFVSTNRWSCNLKQPVPVLPKCRGMMVASPSGSISISSWLPNTDILWPCILMKQD